MFANTHFHSLFSDGALTPEQLVDIAASVGHKALILTDHDTIRGSYFLEKAARKKGILTMLGCEFSTKDEGVSIHLVGVDFNPYEKNMAKLFERISTKQTIRSHILFDLALSEGRMRPGIVWEDVERAFPYNDYLCNNQVFEVMVARGIYKREEYGEFFKECFCVSSEINAEIKSKLPPDVSTEEAVSIVIGAGGVPVVAHPSENPKYVTDPERLIAMGVMGFETRHPDMTKEECNFYAELCTERGLYQLGGTDHSSVMSGLGDSMPQGRLPADCGYATEENFMKLYRRELG